MNTEHTLSYAYGIELISVENDVEVYGFDSNELRAWLDEPVDFDGKSSASVSVPGLDDPVTVTIGSCYNDKLNTLAGCMPTGNGWALDPHPWVTSIPHDKRHAFLAGLDEARILSGISL
jgi:hypothetical protein